LQPERLSEELPHRRGWARDPRNWGGPETRALDPRPKLLRFRMQVRPPTPKHQIEARWRQGKEVYDTARDIPWKVAGLALSPSSVIFGVQTWAIGLSRQRTGGRGQRSA
jgi:hypothetical protein